MNKNLLLFTFLLGLLAVGIGWGSHTLLTASYETPTLVFLTSATWLIFLFMNRQMKPDSFIRNYLLSIVLKLLAGGIFISVIIYLDKPSANANAIHFMIAYLLLTSLEVGFLFGTQNKG
jgi:hypothetical protein